ncbi:MAG: response regulator transcription factor [Acidobacteria bacterium]|nr:response regulator transcription factor [Acidobacteriota bacterium]
MDTFINNISHRKTKVSVLATYALVRSSLQLLLESDRELRVLDVAGTVSELIKKVSHNKPDVVLICLMENEGKNIDLIADLLKVAPKTKAVILSSPNSLLNQPSALKLGVTGIVGTNQSTRILIRAIRRVSEGQVWLNHKVIVQLLDNSFNSTGNGKYKNKGLLRGDDLTKRELEVVRMIGLGLNNKDISKKLYIGETTVRHHLSSIYSKLNIEDRLNLAIYAYQQGIVSSQVTVV